MAKIRKRGQSGAAKNYITRNQALKKLQVTLADFRRLCILKGIFPRQPRHIKRANKGSTAPTTFYYAKDIAYLQHEPVLRALREHKAFAKKLSRAIGRKEWHAAKNLDESRPVYRLDHIIKERYPTFADSLRDLDDAISLLSLFANLPSSSNIAPAITSHCARLCTEWQLYVMRTHSLRKVFLSIKGIYFQALVHGQEVTWLVPYMFTQNVPTDVDFRVMMTFLELYQTLLGFVLYKLYTDEGLVYPPPLDEDKDSQGAGFGSITLTPSDARALQGEQAVNHEAEAAATNALHRKDGRKMSSRDVKRQIHQLMRSAGAGGTGDEADGAEQAPAEEAQPAADDAFVPHTSKASAAPEESLTTLDDLQRTSGEGETPLLFSQYVFYISRECPRAVLEFILRSFGTPTSQIGWDITAGAGSAVEENSERITHHVIDRPLSAEAQAQHGGRRVYVQPQWVVDCVNAKKILPTDPYRPGAALPPHLSPFVDDRDVARRGGYVPTEAGLEGAAEEEASESEEEPEEPAAEAPSAERPALEAVLANPQEAEASGALEAAELEAEAAGGEDALLDLREKLAGALKSSKKGRKPAAPEPSEDSEARDMAKMMLSNKQRKLYNRLGRESTQQQEEKARLQAKKKQLARSKKAT